MIWKVNVFGNGKDSLEISIVEESFEHGFKSYGWFGKNKKYVAGASYIRPVSKELLKDLKAAAQRECDRLNRMAN